MARVGRTRWRLCQLIEEAIPGLQVDPESLQVIRDIGHMGLARWQGSAVRVSAPNLKLSICSWDTMTECVREGIEVTQDRDGYAVFEIHRRGTT
jgi:hypothetical protein